MMDSIRIKTHIYRRKLEKVFNQIKWVKNRLKKDGIDVDYSVNDCSYNRTVCIAEVKDYGNCHLMLIKCCDRCGGYRNISDKNNINDMKFRCVHKNVWENSINKVIIVPKGSVVFPAEQRDGKPFFMKNNFYLQAIPEWIKRKIPKIKQAKGKKDV